MNVLLFLSLISQGFGFLVYPEKIEMDVAPGQTVTRVMKIDNISNDTLFLKVHTENFNIDSTGKTLFSKTASPYTIINPVEFSILPQQELKARVTFRIPDTTANEIWGMIIVTSLPKPHKYMKMVNIATEIGIPFYLSPIGSHRECEMDTSYVRRDSIYFILSNPGIKHIRINGTMTLTSSEGYKSTNRINNSVILPNGKRVFSFPVKALKAGHYVAKLRISYGGPFDIEGVKAFVK